MQVNDVIRELVESWCERREYRALAKVLPAWLGNNALTDGWQDLHDSLQHTHAMCNHLPMAERDAIKRILVEIDVALRDRCSSSKD